MYRCIANLEIDLDGLGELTAKPKRTLPDSNPYSIIEVYEPRQG